MSPKTVRTIISGALSTVLVFSSIPCGAYAQTTVDANGSSVSVRQVSNDSFEVVQDKQLSKITIANTDHHRNVTVTNTATGEKSFFSYDKKARTLYSSITGKTISLDEIQTASSEDGGSYFATRSSGKISYKYVSYKSIRDAIGIAATVATVIGVILSFFPATRIAGKVSGKIADILNALHNRIPNQSNHGLKLTQKTKRLKYIRWGKPVYLTVEETINVTTY